MLIFPDISGALNTGGLISTSGSIKMEGFFFFFLNSDIVWQ